MEDSSIFPSAIFGTPGFHDPHYHRTRVLTPQSDVYGFGVILLELITERDAFNEIAPADEKRLAQWDVLCYVPSVQGHLENMEIRRLGLLADKTMKGNFPQKMLTRLAELAIKCTDDDPKLHPDMSDVVTALNYLAAEEVDSGGVKAEGETSSTQTEGSKQVSLEPKLDRTKAGSAPFRPCTFQI
ncbi:hypothetical protein RJ641_007166 [Dillenia turbinata]|uniref:Protein kinase domain-containing protein n=1 Tax=Dillenia turbinata TaxID=194707 RepID=A0AAN8ZAT8_9MAGN